MHLKFDDNHLCMELYGQHHANIADLERRLGVQIDTVSNEVFVKGSTELEVANAVQVLRSLYQKLQSGQNIATGDIASTVRFVQKGVDEKESLQRNLLNTDRKSIAPRSPNQAVYLSALKKFSLVFGIGPAGTGKTYLAVAAAVAAMRENSVKRLILTRPAVEAGERLGFLPGDMKDKIDPYLRPLYDALYDMLDENKLRQKMESGQIEIAPLAFMRGRTLSDSFVILDEAQNTTKAQMQMFLTRLGEGSKMIITGDPSQIDLPPSIPSGLVHALKILKPVQEIAQVRFAREDVMRHPLVGQIIDAYEQDHKQLQSTPSAAGHKVS